MGLILVAGILQKDRLKSSGFEFEIPDRILFGFNTAMWLVYVSPSFIEIWSPKCLEDLVWSKKCSARCCDPLVNPASRMVCIVNTLGIGGFPPKKRYNMSAWSNIILHPKLLPVSCEIMINAIDSIDFLTCLVTWHNFQDFRTIIGSCAFGKSGVNVEHRGQKNGLLAIWLQLSCWKFSTPQGPKRFRFLKVGGLEDDFDPSFFLFLGGNPDKWTKDLRLKSNYALTSADCWCGFRTKYNNFTQGTL